MASVQIILLSLKRNISTKDLIDQLSKHGVDPLLTARPVEWMIHPSVGTYLLANDWDLLLILESHVLMPDEVIQNAVDASYALNVKLPSPPDNFREQNQAYLREHADAEPPLLSLPKKPLRSLSSQRLELTPSLLALAHSDLCPKGPVSMLNFVSFQPWPGAAEDYKKYVDANKAGPQKRIGSRVKFIGPVDNGGSGRGKGE